MAGRFLSINTERFNKARRLLPPGDSYHDGEALSCRRAFNALRMDSGKKEGKILSSAFFLRNLSCFSKLNPLTLPLSPANGGEGGGEGGRIKKEIPIQSSYVFRKAIGCCQLYLRNRLLTQGLCGRSVGLRLLHTLHICPRLFSKPPV